MQAASQILIVRCTLELMFSYAKVRVNSQRLLQVLANLLSSAIKFSPDKASVEISMQRFNKMLRVTVTDHGIDIPASGNMHHGRGSF